MIEFPISGIETWWWLPVIVAFVISTLTSTGGLSGAFLLLPFQVSVLGFVGPAVTPTNLFFNIVAIPGGVYRYYREKRMLWPLLWASVLGALPGNILGAIIRVKYLPDPTAFKFFVGLVLIYIGGRLGLGVFESSGEKQAGNKLKGLTVCDASISSRHISFNFDGKHYGVPTVTFFLICFFMGIVGAIYGIGGGALLVPIMVAFFRLPVYAISGVALAGTFINSIIGVIIYVVLARIYSRPDLAIAPDWLLGLSFGIGGLAGTYTGATLQKYMPVRLIKAILTACLLFIAVRYIWGYISG
jgi:uncharacterized membrane protein YfcA